MHVLKSQVRGVFALLLAVAGCGGSGGVEISDRSTRATPRHIQLQQLAEAPLRIPADEPFNIHEPMSQQSENGRAHATAEPSGTASCDAQVHDLGSAEAQFQLGHKIDLGSAANVIVKIDVEGDVQRQQSSDSPDTSAGTDLTAAIRDTRGVTLGSEALISGDRYPVSGQFHRLTQFQLALQPDRGYYVLVVGKARASAGGKDHAAAALKLRAVRFEIARHPDAASPASGSAPAAP